MDRVGVDAAVRPEQRAKAGRRAGIGSARRAADVARSARRGMWPYTEVAATPRAGDVVRMNVRACGNGGRSRTDGAPVLHNRFAGRDCPEREFVAARNRLGNGEGRVAGSNRLAGVERLEGRRHVVARADHERETHWLTPLASRPPSTTSN